MTRAIGFDSSTTFDLSQYYEMWSHSEPTASNPTTTLNLLSVIPGQKVYHSPSNIPTDLTRAYIFLTDSTFAVGGTVESLPVNNDTFPQIDLGLISLDASFSWGASGGFQLSLGISALVRPSTASKHQEPAVLFWFSGIPFIR